jgi:hypothetical protein
MASSLLSGLFPDSQQDVLTVLDSMQLGLGRLGSGRSDRRPRWNELDRLEVRQVRPLVEIGQATVDLSVGQQQAPLTLTLDWLERWGGTFGPRSSAAANARRGAGSGERFLRRWDEANGLREPDPGSTADRGGRPAWLLYLSCPQCSRRCRVLYSSPGQHQYACPKCVRPIWRSNTVSASGSRKAGEWARRERTRLKHQQAADRIRCDYLNHTGAAPSMLMPASLSIPKPSRMTWVRFEALCRLVEAHETLAMEVQLAQLQASLARALPDRDTAPEQDMGRWARTVLRLDAWALRQRNWHRRGRPRDTPGQGTRERAARLETSTDSPGHAEKASA